LPVTIEEILKAVNTAKQTSKKRRFTQSMELILSLKDIDLKKPENRFNELVELPHPPSQSTKIAVFATGDLALRAQDAGAQVFGRDVVDGLTTDRKRARNLVRGIDFFLAETTLMPLIGRALGPVLGPKGAMPTPVPPTAPIDTLIERRRRTVQVRIRSQLSAQCKVGSEDMNSKEIAVNIQTIFNRLERRFEKGLGNIREAYVKTTMGAPAQIGIE
jgi:large subunit ribosomal protein L1